MSQAEVNISISKKREGFLSEGCISQISVLQQSVEEGITIGNSESSAISDEHAKG